MGSIDVEKLLEELSPDAPCGEDLEYDPEFGEMERATEGKEEQQFGDTIVPAEPPDWKDVRRKALDLFKRTRDMRVAAHLARAALATDGLGDFHDALKLMRGLVERYWDEVHPQLDPDDDNDPTFRINTLSSLCDADTTLHLLRQAPIVQSRHLGKFNLHQIQLAQEHPEGPGEGEGESEHPRWATIEAAFSDVEPDTLQGTLDAVQQSREDVVSLENTVTEQVGAANATSLSPLVHMLKEIEHVLVEQMERRGIGVAGEEGEAEEAEGAAAEALEGSVAAPGAAPQRLTGQVSSREEAIRALDKVCEYYEKHEPSSPLPLLIRRAQRLANKSFLDIIKDLTPSAIDEAQRWGGEAAEADGAAEASGGDDGW